jgi:hypothetical protein
MRFMTMDGKQNTALEAVSNATRRPWLTGERAQAPVWKSVSNYDSLDASRSPVDVYPQRIMFSSNNVVPQQI